MHPAGLPRFARNDAESEGLDELPPLYGAWGIYVTARSLRRGSPLLSSFMRGLEPMHPAGLPRFARNDAESEGLDELPLLYGTSIISVTARSLRRGSPLLSSCMRRPQPMHPAGLPRFARNDAESEEIDEIPLMRGAS